MKKIPTMFMRDEKQRQYVTDEINPECQWVFDGEGIITRKYDGTGMMLDDDGYWWSRREVKPGKDIPPDFYELNYDEVTGKRQGWVPAPQSPFVKFLQKALDNLDGFPKPGTYELCGPKIQQNSEGYEDYVLIRHADAEIFGTENPGGRRPEDIIKLVLNKADTAWEGIVVHHTDGRMAKLKARDLR